MDSEFEIHVPGWSPSKNMALSGIWSRDSDAYHSEAISASEINTSSLMHHKVFKIAVIFSDHT